MDCYDDMNSSHSAFLWKVLSFKPATLHHHLLKSRLCCYTWHTSKFW